MGDDAVTVPPKAEPVRVEPSGLRVEASGFTVEGLDAIPWVEADDDDDDQNELVSAISEAVDDLVPDGATYAVMYDDDDDTGTLAVLVLVTDLDDDEGEADDE
jgi:hypothetical protein